MLGCVVAANNLGYSLSGLLTTLGIGGAAFAFAYYKTDTIFTSMTIHMIHNTLLILISILL